MADLRKKLALAQAKRHEHLERLASARAKAAAKAAAKKKTAAKAAEKG